MSHSEDRRRADLYELDLRRKAELDPGNCWELIWFLGLPLEVRCSYMRILEARIDQESTRQYFFRQACYHQRNWREQAVPCMLLQTVQSGPKHPWGSIGRRQSRKSAESEPSTTRHSRTRASFVSAPAPPAPTSRKRRETTAPRPRRGRATATKSGSIKPEQPSAPVATAVGIPAIPARPVTPNGLREAVRSLQPLAAQASGYRPVTLDDGRSSPLLPVTPPAKRIYPPGPLHPPKEQYCIDGVPVPHILAFIIATGRAHMEPWRERELPVADAGFDIHDFEKEHPHVLAALAYVLFPEGPGDLTTAIPANRLIIEFVMGWSILPLAHATGQMPRPWQRCSCGEGVVH